MCRHVASDEDHQIAEHNLDDVLQRPTGACWNRQIVRRLICAARTASRRQVKTCWGRRSCRRAISETFAEGSSALATIRSFAARDHRRRGTSGLASSVDTFASINSKLLVLGLCPDCNLSS